MKKLITILIVLLSIPVFGQKHYLGLKGGPSWTNFYTDGSAGKNGYQTGFNGGLTYEYKFKNKFHLEVDFIYAQKRFQPKGFTLISGTIDHTVTNFDVFFESDYLSLPIKGGYSIGNRFQGFLNLGVVPSLLIYAVSTSFQSDEFVASSNRTEQSNRFDLSGLVEIGGSYKLKERFFLFTSFAYQQSFTSITDENYFKYKGDVKHYGMILSLGFKYGIGE